MHSKRRAALIETLAQGVEQVGPEFERFAGIVMGARADVRLTHALRGYPVAGLVDSESDDGREAVEYSDRRGYFDGSMAKAEGDLLKVLKDRPPAKQIYLVAGERARPQKVADFKARVRAWPQMAGKALSLFGSEEIATEIVDHLLVDEQVVGRLTPFRQIPVPVLEGLGADGDRFAWAEIYAEAARIPSVDAVALRVEALRFYDAMVKPADFHAQRRAELLIDMAQAAEAETVLLGLAEKESTAGVERLLARTRLALGDPAGALVRIDAALALLKGEHFRSEFLELRYEIRSKLGDAHARQDLEYAVAASQKKAEGQRLSERLSSST